MDQVLYSSTSTYFKKELKHELVTISTRPVDESPMLEGKLSQQDAID